jgi:hypothetical protein
MPSRTKPDISHVRLGFLHQNTRSLLVLSSPMLGFVRFFQTDSGCRSLGVQWRGGYLLVIFSAPSPN